MYVLNTHVKSYFSNLGIGKGVTTVAQKEADKLRSRKYRQMTINDPTWRAKEAERARVSDYVICN